MATPCFIYFFLSFLFSSFNCGSSAVSSTIACSIFLAMMALNSSEFGVQVRGLTRHLPTAERAWPSAGLFLTNVGKGTNVGFDPPMTFCEFQIECDVKVSLSLWTLEATVLCVCVVGTSSGLCGEKDRAKINAGN